jgi:hypothetical protein
MKKRKILFLGLIILFSIIFLIKNQYFDTFNNGGCGMDAGPVFGYKINTKLNKIKIDELIPFPNGQFGISNTIIRKTLIDTIPPILLKLDKKSNLIWAIKLDTEECGIPLYEMSNIKLVDDKYGKSITFFNLSYSEPGIIYLTDEFEFDYLCLKPF